MKRVVVLGVRGMAGHIIAEYLDGLAGYEMLGVAREQGQFVHKRLNVLDEVALESYLSGIKPDILINGVGVLMAQANEDISNAITTNGLLPHVLAKLGDQLGFKLIHLSTDCVFSGRDGGYTEESPKDGLDSYAKSKALGEVINEKDLTIRTSFIGPELKNGVGLLNWFLQQKGEIRGYTHAYWTGVTTLELAKVIDAMIEQNMTGLYHLSPKEKISKYDLLLLFKRVWHKEIEIVPFEDYSIDKSLVCTRNDFKYINLKYEKMLMEMKVWMDSHSKYYQ